MKNKFTYAGLLFWTAGCFLPFSGYATITPLTCTSDYSGGSIGAANEKDTFSFTATAGERLIVRMADAAGGSLYPRLELYAPSGAKVGENNGSSLARIDVPSAPETGTYIVVSMDQYGTYTGSYGLSLQTVRAACTQSALTCSSDLSNSESIGSSAAMNAYQFTATVGERLIVRMAAASGGLYPQIELYAPSGAKIGENYSSSLARIDVPSAPETGTYIVVAMDEFGTNTGSYGLSLQIVTPACATIINGCPFSSAGSINASGEMDAFVFYASAGDNLTVSLTDQGGNSLYPAFQVFDAAGNLLASANGSSSAMYTLPPLSASGNYFIIVYDYYGTYSGNYTLSLSGCTTNPMPCVSPGLSWQNAPGSVCIGSAVTLGLANTNINFNYILYKNGATTGNVISGTGTAASFKPDTLTEMATFGVRAILKTDTACKFDLTPTLSIGVGELAVNYTAQNETAFNNDGSIVLCVESGTPPFTLEHTPERGTVEDLPVPCLGNFEITGLRAGYYRITVTDKNGCVAHDTIKIDNPDKDRVGFPEKPLLTPNGDGLNDLLVYDGLYQSIDDSELVIFNRYGSVLYRARPYLNDWDATYEGKPVPADVYFYTLRLFGNGETVYKGFITIIR